MAKDNDRPKPPRDDKRRVPVEIDGKRYIAPGEVMSGVELRRLADPDISADRDLWLDVNGPEDRMVEDGDRIELAPGMVFFSVPKVINPGAETTNTALPAPAAAFVEGYEGKVDVHPGPRSTSLVFHDFAVPKGLTPSSVSLLIDLPAGFNATGPDMFWVTPRLTIVGGGEPGGCQATRQEFGQNWQRWSRHIGAGWRSGIDTLSGYVRYIERCLHIEAERGRSAA